MVLFRARDLDAPAKKRARCFDWQRPGIREAYELSVVSLVASGVAVIMGAVSTGQTDSATALGYSAHGTSVVGPDGYAFKLRDRPAGRREPSGAVALLGGSLDVHSVLVQLGNDARDGEGAHVAPQCQ